MKTVAFICGAASVSVASAGLSTYKPVAATEHPVIELDGANPILLRELPTHLSPPRRRCLPLAACVAEGLPPPR